MEAEGEGWPEFSVLFRELGVHEGGEPRGRSYYEDELEEKLEQLGLGEVVGGGTRMDGKGCLRPEVVSTSDWHDEIPVKRKVKSFGDPCSSKDRLGIYHNPNTLEMIEVPKAGCARFWIEFEYGKMLFPAIVDRLDLIEPKIVAAAEKVFGVEFVQGCRWCA